MPDRAELSLAGQTMQWEFTDGPTAGSVYEHTFSADGTVTYRMLDLDGNEKKLDGKAQDAKGTGDKSAAAKKQPTKYASFAVGEGMHLVSYLSETGWTLTVNVNIADQQLRGFASNAKEWYPVKGTIVG
jgi:hypothetical protein